MKYSFSAFGLLALAVLALSGCGGQTTGYSGLQGTWEITDSEMAFGEFAVGRVDYVSFDPAAGRATIYGSMEGSGLRGCNETLVGFAGGNTISFSYPSEGICSLASSSYHYQQTGTDELVLSDALGRKAYLHKVSGLPPDAACKKASFVGDPLEIGFDLASNKLMAEGSFLWVVDRMGNAHRIDFAAASIGGGHLLSNSAYHYAFAMQSGSFWTTCRCGGNEKAKLVALGGTVSDTVDTAALGRKINISAGTYDGRYLWLAGRSEDGKTVYLKIDSLANPNVLVDQAEFQLPVTALTYHDGHLWGLVRFGGFFKYRLVEFDPLTGSIMDSYDLPATKGELFAFYGLASMNGDLYVLADRYRNEPRIYKLAY